MGVTASNIPNFSGKASLSLADLQALSDVVRANMLQAEQPPARVKVGVALPRPAHHIPGSMYFNGEFMAPPQSHVSRPGLVKSMEFATSITQPIFLKGKGYIPLAATVDDMGADRESAVAGGLAGVRWAQGTKISAPRILPGGILEIPPVTSGEGGGEYPPLAEWEPPDKSTAGLLNAVYFDSSVEQPNIYGGNVNIPVAATVDMYFQPLGSAVMGAIAGVQYADGTAVDKPRILQGGIIELPRPKDDTPLANFGPGKDNVPGLVANVAFSLGDPEPTANNGVVSIPLAATVDSASNKLSPAFKGAIGGARWATDKNVTEPRIVPGGILEIPQGGSLQGLQDSTGNAVTWAGVASMAGSQVKVASVLLNTGSTNIPLSVYAGINNGFLTFGLVDAI